MRQLAASARPDDYRVFINSFHENKVVSHRIWVYTRVQKRILSEEECVLSLMKQIAKVTLRRVKQIKQQANDTIQIGRASQLQRAV